MVTVSSLSEFKHNLVLSYSDYLLRLIITFLSHHLFNKPLFLGVLKEKKARIHFYHIRF